MSRRRQKTTAGEALTGFLVIVWFWFSVYIGFRASSFGWFLFTLIAVPIGLLSLFAILGSLGSTTPRDPAAVEHRRRQREIQVQTSRDLAQKRRRERLARTEQRKAAAVARQVAKDKAAADAVEAHRLAEVEAARQVKLAVRRDRDRARRAERKVRQLAEELGLPYPELPKD